MSEPFIGEIRMFGFDYAPRGWAFCDGAVIGIAQNQALFSLLGTTYGGNGINTFALPNLQGRVPVHAGNNVTLGQSAGEDLHTLTTSEIPPHGHQLVASSNTADLSTPAGNFWAVGDNNYYTTAGGQVMAPGAVASVGGQPHENRAPFLVLNFCIALQGLFPSRN